ncbi:hypothetical protein [Pseudomonas viridiflava]|uniref:hypothetical protein n=1 Tax=Pseudomonas viridiflava TaxID=33069 RepID=UPI000F036793|nr:hypothetical protein [Pseudomonas viridiflava]
MSAFAELQARYMSYEAAATIQHGLLTKAASEIVSGFESFLGLAGKRLPDVDGQKGHRYVRLGIGAPSEFKEINWHTLSSRGGVVSFSLALTLDDPASISRSTIVFELEVKFVEHGYEFKVKDLDTFTISAPDAVHKRYEKIYEGLFNRIMKVYDPDRILIKN